MDTRHPHEIHEPAKRAPATAPAPAQPDVPLAERAKRLYLHQAELRQARMMTPEGRAEFIKRIGHGERLARFLSEEHVPQWIVRNAQRGRYTAGVSGYADPRAQLVAHLREAGRGELADFAGTGGLDGAKEAADGQ